MCHGDGRLTNYHIGSELCLQIFLYVCSNDIIDEILALLAGYFIQQSIDQKFILKRSAIICFETKSAQNFVPFLFFEPKRNFVWEIFPVLS